MMIHLPLFEWHPATPNLLKKMLEIRHALGNVIACFQRWLISRGLASPLMRRLVYPLDYIYQSLPQRGFTDIEVSTFAVKSNWAIHPFILARKPLVGVEDAF